ncbi:MAG: hypothetical protein ACSLEY_00770 [Candidatus Saccharimonadales bacterium]
MSVKECEDAYLKLSKEVFKPKRKHLFKAMGAADFLQANGKFESEALETAVKDCIRDKLKENPEDVLLKSPGSSCKVFVSLKLFQ